MRKLALALVVILLLTATAAAGTVTVVDQANRTVTITQPVTRIASVYGIATYYVYALGAGNRLVLANFVGVKAPNKLPAILTRIDPNISKKIYFGIPNVEEIAARSPNVVLANPGKNPGLDKLLNELGIPTVEYIPETPERLKQAMFITGTLLGGAAEVRAHTFAADYDRITTAVATATAGKPPVSVYFCGTDKLRVASGDMYQTDMITLAGGKSVSAGLHGYWNNVSLEQVLAWNPDIIVIAPYGPVTPHDILTDPDWAAITAVRTGRVYKMPQVIAPWDTPVPDSLLGIMWLAAVLHPNVVPLNLAPEIKSFYSTYYGCTLTDAEVARLLPR